MLCISQNPAICNYASSQEEEAEQHVWVRCVYLIWFSFALTCPFISHPGLKKRGKEAKKTAAGGGEDTEMKDAKPPLDDLEEEEEEEEEVEEQGKLGTFSWPIKKFFKLRDLDKESEVFPIADSKW